MQTTNKPVKRFALAVDDKAIQKLLSDIESANTGKNTKWATSVFDEWRKFLIYFGVDDLNIWLLRYVIEVRKTGSPYPSNCLSGTIRAA